MARGPMQLRRLKAGPVSNMCPPFSNFGNWITFGPLRIRCLFYIWTTLLSTVHSFAVIISLHIRKCAILLHLTWLNSKKLDITLFLLYSHEGWTATLVCDSVYSPLDLGWVYFLLSMIYCTSATGFPDKNFNKKPNSANMRSEKGQTDCLKARKSQTLFAVLPFYCHKKCMNYKNTKKIFF